MDSLTQNCCVGNSISATMDYQSTITSMNDRTLSLLSWETTSLIVPVAVSFHDDTMTDVDIKSSISHGKRPGKIRNDTTCWFMPSSLCANDEETREKICSIIYRACKASGFKVTGRHRPSRGKPNSPLSVSSISFQCYYGRIYDEEAETKRNAKRQRLVKHMDKPPLRRCSKVSRPIKSIECNASSELLDCDVEHFDSSNPTGTDTTDDEMSSVTCKCHFSVYWDQSNKRWFLPFKQSGSLLHNGHIKLDKDHIRISSKHLISVEEQSLSLDSQLAMNSATATHQLLAKAVDGNGDRGRGMMRDGLNRLINEQYSLNPSYKSTSNESSEGMVSLPATCTEKVGKRKHKITSPSK